MKILIELLVFATTLHHSLGFWDNRVYWGQKAEQENNRHLVYFSYSKQPFCSGSIIAPCFILTAGHCFDNEIEGPIKVYTYSDNRPQLIARADEKDVTIHPEYVGHRTLESISHDLAMVRTRRPMAMNHYNLKCLKLALALPALNEQATLSGFGLTNGNEQFVGPSQGTVNIVDCHRTLYPHTHFYGIVCTYGPVAAPSDSGGSLAYNGRLVAVTVASDRTYNLSYSGTYYANVIDHKEWIQTNLERPREK